MREKRKKGMENQEIRQFTCRIEPAAKSFHVNPSFQPSEQKIHTIELAGNDDRLHQIQKNENPSITTPPKTHHRQRDEQEVSSK